MRAVRRAATFGLVAAIMALGLAAGVDALRGEDAGVEGDDSGRGGQAATTTAETAEVSEADRRAISAELGQAGVRGALTYADDDCRVHAVELPSLAPLPAPADRSCLFQVSPGNVVSFGGAVADPSRFFFAECNSLVELPTSVVTLGTDGRVVARYRGCAPTWRDDGALTIVRGGEAFVLEGRLDHPGEVRANVVLSRRELTAAFRTAGWPAGRFSVREIAWLRGARLATIVRVTEKDEVNDVLTVFEGPHLVRAPTFAYADLRGLRPSPRGRYALARSGSGGLAVVDRGGRPVLERFRGGRVLAWSPDERFGASANQEGIYVFRLGDRSASFIRLPFVARDLVWR